MTRVLVAEDNASVAEILQTGLQQSGYEVVLATNGQAALEIALTGNVDIALLDILMPPGISGFDVLRKIREREANLPRHLPVILLTASQNQDEQNHGMQAGADAYRVKPMRLAHLVSLIQSLLPGAPPAS
jgi:DNA-binding response OmpR family regulator